MALYSLFGYKRVLHDSLKLYKKRTDENYKKIRKILERFEKFNYKDDDNDNSLDFSKEQTHYKLFGKKNQNKLCTITKELFLQQYDTKRKEILSSIIRDAKKLKRGESKT